MLTLGAEWLMYLDELTVWQPAAWHRRARSFKSAQWWICRMNKPPRTSNDSSIVLA
jgi:hypothetical protein